MDKEVYSYKQRGDTCAVVCMMMVLEYYNIIKKSNWYDERRFYKIYGSKYIAGTPFSALAYHLSKNGLNTTIYHSSKHLFKNKGTLSEYNFKLAMDEYKEYLKYAKESGTKVVNGIEINTALLIKKIQTGNFIIVAGQINEYYHAILLIGYENNHFIVCDPLYKNKVIRTTEEIEKFIDTDIGKWFITVNDKK